MKLKSKLDKILAGLSGTSSVPLPSPTPKALDPFDASTPLLQFGDGHVWTLSDAYMGVQVLGGTGSGKTSSSGASMALSFLQQGFGGLVLSAKPDERDLWERYCAQAGRKMVIFGPERGYRFNPLAYEIARGGRGAGITGNVADTFMSISETTQGKGGGTNEDYFRSAMRQLLCRSIDVVSMATGSISLPNILDAIMSAPQSRVEAESQEWKDRSFLAECLREAETKRTKENAADLDHTRRFWLQEFPSLGDRTRSSIVSMVTVTADPFLTGPMRELFCTDTNIVPEMTHMGEIIFIDIPVEVYKDVGVAAQLLWKHVWMEATARREPDKDGGRPTFLFADESQFFCSKGDLRFQATARSKRACTVYLSQNLPTLFDRVGQDRTNALLGNLQTKIFHSNGDPKTNEMAASTIARGVIRRSSMNVSTGGGASFGENEAVDFVVPPAEFQRLRRGGPENGNLVDAYIFQAGRIWPSTGESFMKVTFKQPQLEK